ncbi:MAG: ThiF family adenylyltransferase [Holophagales bacterium]|nr:ThiF family adenylyltransferase [Gemmatimonadota bacterium]MYJ25488.1 ThiF family adenylyltransferase [Holophagales bacterium]
MDRFDRQRRLFGDAGQEHLRTASVGIVGAGGLGSFMALELAYLGVGKLLIVDDDCLDEDCSNRNRLVGAWASHQPGTPKVQILRELIFRIDPKIDVTVVKAPLEDEEAKAALAAVDVVVGCVDHDGPRFALNEFCCTHDLPLIDAASDTKPDEGEVLFGGRICVATPKTGCLMCLGVLDQSELQEYMDSPDQRADREAIYGVPHNRLTGGGPSVVTVNGVVASVAATELMVLLTRVRAPIAHQEWRGHEGSLRRVADRGEDCYYCGLRCAT